MTPPPPRTPDQWADQNRILPSHVAEPGPYRSARTPYLIPIYRRVADPLAREIDVMFGSQMSKTEGAINILGWRFDDDPVPTIIVFPTEHAARTQLEPRLSEMLRSTASLNAKTAVGQKNKIHMKNIGGVTLRIAWAGSGTELRSQAAAFVIVDELDAMEPIPGEGDPVELVKARGITFTDRKILVMSTPTIGSVETELVDGLEHWKLALSEDLQSKVWLRWQSGTRHEWAWPCPHCETYFIPRLKNLTWPKGATPDEARQSAFLRCPHCGDEIRDGRKTEMNAAGIYVAPGQRIEDGQLVGEHAPNQTYSYWVSGLCSPWRTFGEAAQDYVKAVATGDPFVIQVVVNTTFGELYSIAGEAIPWEEIKAKLTLGYNQGEMPESERIIGLVMGVDVQNDRFIYEVRAFGPSLTSYLIETDEIWGDPRLDDTKDRLMEVVDSEFAGHSVRICNIDSGYLPEVAYDLAYRFPRVRATKGQDQMSTRVRASKVDVTIQGQVRKKGLQLWHISTGDFKGSIYGKFAWPAGQPGAMYAPLNTPDRYWTEITAEKRITRPSGRVTWVRVRKSNHALDTCVLAFAAAWMLNFQAVKTLAPPKKPAPPSQPTLGAPTQPVVPAANPRPIRYNFQRRPRRQY